VQLEYDILEYVVIERLAQGGRDKLKDDGLNLSDWLQSLASFLGHLYVYISSFPKHCFFFFCVFLLVEFILPLCIKTRAFNKYGCMVA
jgi:membrane-anchored protein YejM (alkaline phosphatase superfamily)